jgi:CubicO group peptidase (beta-lactamase class C family)
MAPWNQRDGPGVAVLVVSNGRTLFEKGYGMADIAGRVPIDERTIFDLGSLSKQYTATAILLLVQPRKLRLDEQITEVYPEYRTKWKGVTVRMLLNHTAGIPDFVALFRAKGPSFNDFPRTSRGSSGVAEQSFSDLIALAASAPLNFAPGSAREYCNSCYLILAGAVERVTGERFPDFVEANLFAPLGMSHTSIPANRAVNYSQLARSYYRDSSGWVERDYTPLEALYGSGGIHSTLVDLAKWYTVMDQRFVIADSLAALETQSGRTTDGALTHYGMGWVVDTSLGLHRLAHGGWWKGYRNAVLRYPDQKLTVVLLSNDADFAPFRSEIAFRIARLFLANELRFPQTVVLSDTELAEYAGSYQTSEGDSYVIRRQGPFLEARTPDTTLSILPQGGGRFFVRGVEEEWFQFTRRPDGIVELMRSEPGLGGTIRTVTVAEKKAP